VIYFLAVKMTMLVDDNVSFFVATHIVVVFICSSGIPLMMLMGLFLMINAMLSHELITTGML